MKVLLLKDVKDLGRSDQVIETSDGYALNYLIPRRLAVTATSTALAAAKLRHAQHEAQKEVHDALVKQALSALAEARLVLTVKVNEKGHLYDAVHAHQIVALVKHETQVELTDDMIRLEKPIKEVGTYTIPLSHGDTFGSFILTVEAE
jgi:large subunit ribosomal protein L9